MKTILIWNKLSRIASGRFFGTGSAPFREKCPVTECQIVTERSAMSFSKYDAVVFNMFRYEVGEFPEDLNLTRRNHQRYVFMSQESLDSVDVDIPKFNNYFNWTMSYGRESDILMLYGRVIRKASAPDAAERLIERTHGWTKNYLAGKSKSVAWMVSHCETYSLRETYVDELRKYIDVDIYGKCGNLTCKPKRSDWLSHSECYDVLANNYKFYLSFENSLCPDYATEKFFLPLIHDIVPVVYGGANYTALAPPHSFIDALQFTPRQLARYLHRVGSNKTLYNEFFWWKDHYEVEAETYQMLLHAYCDLCKKLHEDDRPKIYPNITTLWDAYAQCMSIDPWNIRSIIPSNWFL